MGEMQRYWATSRRNAEERAQYFTVKRPNPTLARLAAESVKVACDRIDGGKLRHADLTSR